VITASTRLIHATRSRHADASGMEPVLVLRDSKPGLQTSRMKRLLDGWPGTRLAPSDGHWSVRAVAIIILNIEIALRFAKIRHDLLIRPFIVAESRPGVEILRETALQSPGR